LLHANCALKQVKMSRISCGIDFGTSNSSIALASNSQVSLVPVEGSHVTIPSAIFFNKEDNKAFYGRAAVAMFLERHEGRFMRSLKRVLGTSLMKQGTLVNGKLMKFDRIIASFLRNIKTKADTTAEHPIEHVVMGRPVHFVDNDPAADERAEQELRAIALSIGFKYVDFQFEPIAAAFAHEVKINGERLALVADLGGGTSDFTVIRLSNKNTRKVDRSTDILANTGVRIGGNDFDRDLSLAAIMPEIGYKSTYGEKHLEVPLKPYHDLAEWSKVNFLYTPKIMTQMRQLLNSSHDRKRFSRLLQILEQETGHAVLAATEETKIALTAANVYHTPFNFLEEGLYIPVMREQFEEAIRLEVARILDSVTQCMREAGVQKEDIDLVILTGGSTEVPLIQAQFRQLFPNAALADENKLSSVGLGLAYDSQNRYQ
jgi:hypothetical chaperone protein